jgi:hypothetical protein
MEIDYSASAQLLSPWLARLLNGHGLFLGLDSALGSRRISTRCAVPK